MNERTKVKPVPAELPIVKQLAVNVTVTYRTYAALGTMTSTYTNVGYVLEERNGTLVIEDRHGIAISKYAPGAWLKYDVPEYTIPGDHVEMPNE